MEPTGGDRVRVTVDKDSFPEDRHLALRAYLRHLSLDDRMLDRKVRFQRSEADADGRIAAIYDVVQLSS